MIYLHQFSNLETFRWFFIISLIQHIDPRIVEALLVHGIVTEAIPIKGFYS